MVWDEFSMADINYFLLLQHLYIPPDERGVQHLRPGGGHGGPARPGDPPTVGRGFRPAGLKLLKHSIFMYNKAVSFQY